MRDHHYHYHSRRPRSDVDAHQHEALLLTPSCVSAVNVITNGQVLATQAQRSALKHFAICPLLHWLLLHHVVFARSLSYLSDQVLPSSDAHALSCKCAQSFSTTGQWGTFIFRLQEKYFSLSSHRLLCNVTNSSRLLLAWVWLLSERYPDWFPAFQES